VRKCGRNCPYAGEIVVRMVKCEKNLSLSRRNCHAGDLLLCGWMREIIYMREKIFKCGCHPPISISIL